MENDFTSTAGILGNKNQSCSPHEMMILPDVLEAEDSRCLDESEAILCHSNANDTHNPLTCSKIEVPHHDVCSNGALLTLNLDLKGPVLLKNLAPANGVPTGISTSSPVPTDIALVGSKAKPLNFDFPSAHSDSSNSLSPVSPIFTNGVLPNSCLKDLQLIAAEYDLLKEKYLELQKEYGQSLARDAAMQALVDVSVTDESFNILHSMNAELREQLSKLLTEVQSLHKDNQRLQAENEILRTSSVLPNVPGSPDLVDALQKTVDRLEQQCQLHRAEALEAAEKLEAHDSAAKRAISALQKEMALRVEQVTKMYQESVNEKDAFVIQMSKLESTNLEQSRSLGASEKKAAELGAEIERLKGVLKAKEADSLKLQSSFDASTKQISKLTKKIDAHQEELESAETKAKWAQNKLKQELESHKETKKQIALLVSKLQEAKEEGDQLRMSCQEMIKQYQSSEEMKSVQLDKEIKEQENRLKLREQEFARQDEAHRFMAQELKSTRDHLQKVLEESVDLKTQIIVLEEKNTNLDRCLSESRKDYAEIQVKLEELKEKANRAGDLEFKVAGLEKDLRASYLQLESLKAQLHESDIDREMLVQKQQELLQYSSKMTENNAAAKSYATEIQRKLELASAANEDLKAKFQRSEEELKMQVSKLEEANANLQAQLSQTAEQVKQKCNVVTELSASLEEARDQARLLKKKTGSQIKDLQRQLRQTTGKIEQLETTSQNDGSTENLALKSRSSSAGSLEKISADLSQCSTSPSSLGQYEGVVMPQDHSIVQPSRQKNNPSMEIEVDKRVLVERICKLQKVLAKKSEKIEFMEEHVAFLTEELQKKSRIVQFYLVREEAGTIAPQDFDNNKADLSKHGGIMASVYTSNPIDKSMTLELSLTINRRLQAVLEDTLLKNIMLKDNLNTLGDEIARLQQKNRELQLRS